jgi:site-specific recombinase XerD
MDIRALEEYDTFTKYFLDVNTKESLIQYTSKINTATNTINKTPQEFTPDDVHKLRQTLIDRELNDNYINDILTALKTYWLYTGKEITGNKWILALRPRKRIKRKLPTVFVFNDMPTFNPDGYVNHKNNLLNIRDFFIIIYMRFTGGSIEETRNQRVEDIIPNKKVDVYRGKHRGTVEKNMHANNTENNLFWSGYEYYMDNRIHSDYLFSNNLGDQLSKRSIDANMRKATTGLFGKPVKCHTWRHTKATVYCNNPLHSVQDIKQFFGWTDINLINSYLNVHAETKELQNFEWIEYIYNNLGVTWY